MNDGSLAVAAGVALAGFALAQANGSAVVPAICSSLPGNAAIALPLRWSQGTMQTFVEASVLPASLAGQTITGLWLRRPALPGDVAYAPVTRTLTVRGGFLASTALQLSGSLAQNRPATTTVLFGPAPVTSLAVQAPGAATTVGDDLLHVVFTQPLPMAAGTLFLEFETSDAPLQISTEHWVDAIWQSGGYDQGYVVPVGDGSCTTRSEPTRLAWTSTFAPAPGVTGALAVTGAPPTLGSSAGWVLVWAGLDPETRGPGPGYLGFGGALSVLDPAFAGCHQWAPFDLSWLGPTNASGTFVTSLPIPGTAAVGTRIGLQAAWIDTARPGLPLSFGNGLALVAGAIGVGWRCSTAFFPAGASTSPWPPFIGQMPVLRLEY